MEIEGEWRVLSDPRELASDQQIDADTRDAESLRASLSHLNVHSTGHLFKVENDPRVTPLGPLAAAESAGG